MKDQRNRCLVRKFEMRRLILKCLVIELSRCNAPDGYGEHNWRFQDELTDLPTQSSRVQVRNRCILTNRSRGVSRHFRLSRICIRDLANAGLLPGVSKSSW